MKLRMRKLVKLNLKKTKMKSKAPVIWNLMKVKVSVQK